MKRIAVVGLVALGLNVVGVSEVAQAQGNLVTNGGFETTTNGGGQMGYNTNATGWTTTGYNFLFTSGSADTTGVTGSDGNLQLWGPNNGSANGLPAASPMGGIYLAADGAYEVEPITQTINNLVIGQMYGVSFWWGAAQQSGFTGPTTDQWVVDLGSSSHSTAVASIPSHGFSGWLWENFTYTATATSETLSFLANGTPSGVPPFALLDGVSLTAVPEPSNFLPMIAGVAGLGLFVRRRRNQAKKSVA